MGTSIKNVIVGMVSGAAPVADSGNYNDLTNKPTIPPAYVAGMPIARTLALATAYQATDPTKSALLSITLTSTASLSLSGGTTITGDALIGLTAAVAAGTGTIVAKYRNSLTGALTIGLNISTDSAQTINFLLPAGAYFAIRQTAGTTLAILAAVEQVAN